MAGGEELIQLLFDRRSYACNSMTNRNKDSYLYDIVLSLAISKASTLIVTRFINKETDLYRKKL